MRHLIQRMGFLRLSRGVAVTLIVIGALVAVSFWIGPFRPLPARLSLYVTGGELEAPNTVRLEPVRRQGTTGVRFPLVLAVRNTGARAAEPSRLHLSVPTAYRVVRGVHPVTPQRTPGNPLSRYSIDVTALTLPPDSTLHMLPGDTLWLEPDVRDFDCVIRADSIPGFVAAPPRVPSAMASIPVFYSFDGTPERQTGTFVAAVDSVLLRRPAPPAVPTFPSYVREPEAPRPQMGMLHNEGVRATSCGDEYNRVDMYSVVWESASGGRFIELYVNGKPRKHLFDLDRDSIIELEMWDADGNGRFESWSQARYPVPTLALPERLPIEAVTDSALNDPAWQNLFDDTITGPYRFLPDSARRRRMPAVPAGAIVTRVDSVDGTPRVVVDTAWLRKFNDAAAGPYRFLANPPQRRAQPVDTTRVEAPRRPRGPRPLGKPVPFPGPGG